MAKVAHKKDLQILQRAGYSPGKVGGELHIAIFYQRTPKNFFICGHQIGLTLDPGMKEQ
jgi:hypothetical protein